MTEVCEHIRAIRPVEPSSAGCQECLQLGDDWVHLRLCLTCGHVGCCDSSKNRHATKHFHKTHHPITQSPNHPIFRTRRGLALVLRGSDNLKLKAH
jgi:uncharacterized UBP type Zn finger protein